MPTDVKGLEHCTVLHHLGLPGLSNASPNRHGSPETQVTRRSMNLQNKGIVV